MFSDQIFTCRFYFKGVPCTIISLIFLGDWVLQDLLLAAFLRLRSVIYVLIWGFVSVSLNQSCGSGFTESGSGYGSGPSIINYSGYGSNPDPGFWWPKSKKKNTAENFFFFFWSKIAICFCPRYRRSLQPSKENIQHFKKWNWLTFFYVCGLFLSSWIRIQIANPDTDPGTPLNADRYMDPDPQHCFEHILGWSVRSES